MGNVISLSYDFADNFYEKYYPKSNCLRPVNMSSVFMVSLLGSQLFLNRKYEASTLNNFIFLFSTGSCLGIQLWITCVSGLTMMRLLPRHQFGLVQSYLFPKYFFLTSSFNCAALFIFLKMNPLSTWKNENLILGSLLTTSFICSLVNSVWLNVKTIYFNQTMHKIERSAGEGITIIGKLKHQNKVESDPEYLLVRKKFGFYHGLSLTTSLISFASTCAQFYFLASRSYFSF